MHNSIPGASDSLRRSPSAPEVLGTLAGPTRVTTISGSPELLRRRPSYLVYSNRRPLAVVNQVLCGTLAAGVDCSGAPGEHHGFACSCPAYRALHDCVHLAAIVASGYETLDACPTYRLDEIEGGDA